MNEPAAPVTIALRIPGQWSHPRELIQRLPAKHRYVLTPVGCRVALFFSKTYARILRPGLARLDPDLAPNPADLLADAWRRLDVAVDRLIQEANIAA